MSDFLYAERVEGIEPHLYSEEEWNEIKSFQLIFLDNVISEESSRIFASRILNPVVEMIKKHSEIEYNSSIVNEYGEAKMILFSVHDFQLYHTIKLLNFTDFSIDYIDFSSNLFIELYQQDSHCNES